MWGVALIYIAVASICCRSCNAELYQIKTADLPRTDDNRIIGGSPTTIEQYPFAVQVICKKRYHCGGSLVTTRHVLSAAHCFVTKDGNCMPPSSCSIRAGTTFLNKGGSLHLVTAIKAHEQYDFMTTKTYKNDVAVVLMATPVQLTTSVARLALIPYQDAVVPDNSFVTAIGWGRTDEANPAASPVLYEVTVRKINLKTCESRYMGLQVATGKVFTVTSSMICAGILDVGGKDSCRGDSGGSLLYKGIVVGVTSWGAGCAKPKYPGVYARVANYTNWINYTINDSQLQIQGDGSGKGTNHCNTGSLSSKVGAITLLTSLLYLILSV